MKRSTFVRLATASTVALYLPGLYCTSKDSTLVQTLSQPNALQHICDAKTILEIGEAYRQQASSENDKTTLVKILTENSSHVEGDAVLSLLNKKVTEDFQLGKTVIVDGWILSLTEARQCALYSLTKT